MGNVPPIIKQPAPKDDNLVSTDLPVQVSKLLESRSIELLGTREFPVDGLLCYEIKMIRKGRTYFLYINTSSFLLEYWNDREDGDLSILAKVYNYKRVDGLLIPMSDCLMKDGIVYYSSHIKKYLINAYIDPQVFIYKDN